MNDDLINLFRKNNSVSWVAEQLEETISKGRTMSMQDASTREGQSLESPSLTTADKKKRMAYETTIELSEDEILEVIKTSYEAVFLTLPSLQKSAVEGLKDLGIDFDSIEFDAPDEPGVTHSTHSLSQNNLQFDIQQAKDRLTKFFELVD